jgi:hypothetical protein
MAFSMGLLLVDQTHTLLTSPAVGRSNHAISHRPRLFYAFAIVWHLVMSLFPLSTVRAENTDYIFKATFLVNFARLIEWPSTAFNSPEDPLVMCVLDPVPFGEELKAIDGKMAMGRRLAIQSFEQVLRSQVCHILYVNTGDLHRRRYAIQALSGKPVLVVGEEEGFARHDGMIAIYPIHNRIGFEINPVRTEMAGLRVSSRLLKLGRIVIAGESK